MLLAPFEVSSRARRAQIAGIPRLAGAH